MMSSQSGPPTDLVIGADIGGTKTRAAVADRSGRVLAVAEQPAGNPNAVGVAAAAERIRVAVEQALRQAQGPGGQAQGSAGQAVRAIVLGMAGFGTALDAGEEFLSAALPTDLQVRPRIVSDLAVAYASATSLPRGTVLIAGTGSSAADIDDGDIVSRRGGWGWLLGDEGAGFWLGREAVRQALTELEHGHTAGALTGEVVAALGIDGPDRFTGLLRVPYLDTPIRLAELAPIVTGLVDSDPAAASICARAAAGLSDLVLDLGPLPGRPIVVAGSVLQSAGPIRTAFTQRITAALGSPVLQARSGLVGALWLATGTDRNGRSTGLDREPAIHQNLLATIG
ncbi:N-acetylglucosamine kinase [Microlunatus soli]|uniref:BadF-type ATPase n=1 Tax=Microlunatus soli TaxID=630515 RepID=A0A1H1ZSJ7_9ACTN|nr:BadF/BadG/BcrA/BcrD ATPase family protein [Microlunatus soli]SDT36567.1 BadF-type ATPase [Microlunatus soli]